ncbi:hypothetical protein, partial [Streptomyces sp. NPDC001274]
EEQLVYPVTTETTDHPGGPPPLPRRRPGAIKGVFLEGREKPHCRLSRFRPFVGGRSRQVRVQRWLLLFEQE